MSTGRLLLEVARWAVAWVLLWRVPTPRRSTTTATTGRPTVVIPARDEADNLTRLLPSLAQGGFEVEVIVVDDGSTDGTGDVARAHGARVVAAGPLPAGWTGKANACRAGAGAADRRSDRLVFLDADVVVEPGGLARVLAEHDACGGLLSVQPWHAMERPYEQLSAFFNLVAMMSVDAFSPLGRRLRPTGAFGPCLVLPRRLYESTGGHGAAGVRGAVLDDVAMAQTVQRAGAPVAVLGGRGSLRFRMYPRGPAQLLEGWSKNFAGGAAGTRPITLVLVLVWMSGLIGTVVDVEPAFYAAYVAQLVVLFRRVGGFSPLTALLYPVPLAFFVVVFLRSLVLTFVRREVRWRGRTIRT
ncbi:MAG TPA: glycosyltransferase family 2 protein [Acidimicrobiales bacterium]|nr:glycosyltransferase family 2 protein [Acidimicrobiales bacterium]